MNELAIITPCTWHYIVSTFLPFPITYITFVSGRNKILIIQTIF